MHFHLHPPGKTMLAQPLCRKALLLAAGRRLRAFATAASTVEQRYAVDDAPSAADVAALQAKFKGDPAGALVSFTAKGLLTSGLRSAVTIRDKFVVPFDEPPALGGTDTAPNPVEGVLAALGTCQEITYKAFGRAGGVQLDGLSSAFVGDIDLRGFFAVSEDARAGFHDITGTVVVEAPGMDAAGLEQLKAVVDAHCPVLDSLAHPIDVNLALECKRVGSGLKHDDAPSAELIGELQKTFGGDKGAAQARFKATTELNTGLRSTASVRDTFLMPADEPPALGGTDTAPNPVELLLASLASCQEITYKAFGRAMGLELTKVSCTVTGHIDLRGFFAVAPYEEARPGFYRIDGTVHIESTAPDEALQQLKAVVDAHCPVLDMLRNAVPVAVVATLK
jgi:uncharacterized OsmC-like protein